MVSGTPGTPVGIQWAANGGASPSQVAFDFGQVGGTDGLSQFASPTSVAFVNQNGAEVGELNAISIDDQGFVSASFTNGEDRRLYRLPVATFANPAALDPRSGNVYAQTDASGEFNLRTPAAAEPVSWPLPRSRPQRRSGRGVHQDDRHAARLFRQRQGDQYNRPDVGRADPHD